MDVELQFVKGLAAKPLARREQPDFFVKIPFA
jgi:hypothetical protein